MTLLVGIDIGTSGVKCLIIDESGRIISAMTNMYPSYAPKLGWSEQNPHDWWMGSQNAIRKAIHSAGVDSHEIAAVGFSGQMHGLVALDKNDEVIRPAILWNDQRTDKECAEVIESAGGLDHLLEFTNNTMLTGYTGGKILWLRNNELLNYQRMHSFLMPKDYVRFMLTDEKATDVSDASGNGVVRCQESPLESKLIELLGLDLSCFPKVYESDEIAGYITREAAALTGLKEGTPAYAGGGDAVIQTTGMGIVREGLIGLIIGTSGVVSMSLDSFGPNVGGALQFFCNNDRNKWQAFGCQLSSGGSLEWLKKTFFKDESYAFINKMAAKSPAGSGHLLFLPYLSGERSPYADPYARGVFFGLTLLNDLGDIARSVMEGVTFGLRDIYEQIRLAKKIWPPMR